MFSHIKTIIFKHC